MNDSKCFEEDEIDLKELFNTILKYKKFLSIFTITVTIIAAIYAYNKPNIYQTDSLIEIGYYNNNQTRNIIENPKALVEKLKIDYDVAQKERQQQYPVVKSISQIKRTKNLILISTLGLSKKSAKELISSIDSKIIKNHSKIINSYKRYIEDSIKTQQKELDKITLELKKRENEYLKNKQMIQKLNKTNPSLSAIYTIEVLKQESDIQQMKDQRFTLLQQINNAKMQLSKTNISPTKVVKVTVYKNHVKPKRKLIVIVSFITSFILAIFLIFFIEFIRNNKSEQ